MRKPSPTHVDSRLPMWRTVRAAYAITFRHLLDFLRISRFWLLAMTFIVISIAGFFWPSHQAAMQAGKAVSWVQIATSLVSLVAVSSIAVGWHRLVVLGERPRKGAIMRLDGTVGRYALTALIMLLPFYIPLLLLDSASSDTQVESGVVNAGLSFAVLIAGIVLGVKVSIILPAIALSRNDVTISRAWRATAWSWWRMFLGLLLTTLPPSLVLFMPAMLRIGTWDSNGLPPPETHLGFIRSCLETELGTVLSGLVALSFLSQAFRHFFAVPEEPAGE
jgi:hypothetical protein